MCFDKNLFLHHLTFNEVWFFPFDDKSKGKKQMVLKINFLVNTTQ